jgi:hypothetical protein
MEGYICARHDFLYIRGWMQMVFYYYMIYFPETDKQIMHRSRLQLSNLQWSTIQQYNNNTYSVHNEVLMSQRARPSYLLGSHERLPRSTVGNWLLILSPARRARPPFSPPPFMVAPFPSGSTHSLLSLSVTICMYRWRGRWRERWRDSCMCRWRDRWRETLRDRWRDIWRDKKG